MTAARNNGSRGFVTLLFLLVLLSVGSYYLLRSLNDATRTRNRDHDTAQALATARDALLGYAASYPDRAGVGDADAGPGRLPCADRQLGPGHVIGAADYPCVNSDIGRFPWHTLDVAEQLDANGAPLWYAPASNFRVAPSATQWINSETPGGFALDDCAGAHDIVALLLAPGPSLASQAARTSQSYTAAHFLEGENLSTNDCFSSALTATQNDRVLPITQRQLMQAAARRVAADIRNALQRYYAFHDGQAHLPWLAPFLPPLASNNRYQGEVGRTRGLLPLRRINQKFDAAFTADWSIPTGGTVTLAASGTPNENCLRNSADPSCTDASAWPPGVCEARADSELRCETVRRMTLSGELIQRTYTFVLKKWAYELAPATTTTRRLQHFSRAGTLIAADSLEITLKDEQLDSSFVVIADMGSSTLILPTGAAIDSFSLLDVPFDLEVDSDGVIDPTDGTLSAPLTRRSPGELPQWFTANRWHTLFFIAYADAFAPGNTDTTCAPPGCLTLTRVSGAGTVSVDDKIKAIVIGAGAPLATQTRTVTSVLSDYYEVDNASDDSRFEQRATSDAFNDRIDVIPLD